MEFWIQLYEIFKILYKCFNRIKENKGKEGRLQSEASLLEHGVWRSNQDLILTGQAIFLPQIHKTLGPQLSSLQRCSEGPSTVSYPKQKQSAPDLLNFQCWYCLGNFKTRNYSTFKSAFTSYPKVSLKSNAVSPSPRPRISWVMEQLPEWVWCYGITRFPGDATRANLLKSISHNNLN